MATRLKARPPGEVKPGRIKGNVFGNSGAGKTWFALQFPRPYFIDTEGGADLKHYMERLKAADGAYLGREDGSCDFDIIIDQMKALATEPHPYKTLVIDSITKVYQSEIARKQEELGEKDVFGASKKPAIQRMRRLIQWIDKLDMNIWFISHETLEWANVDGQRQEVGRIPDCWEKLVYELDLTLRIVKGSKGNRYALVHKSRLQGFPDGDRFDLQVNGTDVSYAAFSERYGRDFIEADAKTIVLATPEQVVEINRLLGVLRIDQTEIDKVLSKAGAETWDELNTEQAAKTVEWLFKKVTP